MLLFKDVSPEILLPVTFKLFTDPCIQVLRLQASFKEWKMTVVRKPCDWLFLAALMTKLPNVIVIIRNLSFYDFHVFILSKEKFPWLI